MVNINLSNKAVYTIIALFIIIVIAGFVYAYGGTQPSVMGHSLGEIAGIDNLTGFCVFSANETGCPPGWSEGTEYSGRTIRADSANVGNTGGSDTHTHTIPGESTYDGSGHHVGKNSHTGSSSSWSPYINVLICCKD